MSSMVTPWSVCNVNIHHAYIEKCENIIPISPFGRLTFVKC
jgi:hypothetical protein